MLELNSQIMPTPLPPLTALRAFEATVRLGSVGAAAAELRVTHGAVSRQLQALEQALGQPVLVRAGRGLRPSEAGVQLQQVATAAFEQLRRGWAGLQADATQRPLVIGCPGSVLARWMIPRLGELAAALPTLKVHLSAQQGDIAADLAGLDALLLLGQPPWPAAWQVDALAPECIGPVFSPQLGDASQLAQAPPTALLQQPLLHTLSRPQAWPSWLQAHDLPAQPVRLGNGFEHLYYLLEAAVAGLGVAIAPQPLVAADMASGRLLAPWGFTATGGQWVLCRRAGNRDRRLDQLADWMRGQLQGNGLPAGNMPAGALPAATPAAQPSTG